MAGFHVEPFRLLIPDTQLDDLRTRLASTRWPSAETIAGWARGVPISAMKELHNHWLASYDWRKCEAWFNSYPQFKATIDGEEIHFLHIKSRHTGAIPMLLIHGWPGSVLEFRKVIDPLVNDSASDAFHLVIPSLPGYSWSSKPATAGWNVEHISRAFVTLMGGLGYEKWVAQGGDWGADIVAVMASERPPASLAAVHMNSVFFNAHTEIHGEPADEGEKLALSKQLQFENDDYGYFLQQRTRPQTLAYLLADSPVGQAAWIYEKIYKWTQHSGNVHDVLSMDDILDNVMVYWLSNSGGSSAMLYSESEDNTALPIDLPIGVSVFPEDINFAPREWGERYYTNIIHWREVERGGHFPAWEVPDIFVREVRETFRHIRQ